MGNKVVCIQCKNSFNTGSNFLNHQPEKCGVCGNALIQCNQKFKPPKATDTKAWQVIEYLLGNDFRFQSIYNEAGKDVPYPTTMEEAKEFVRKYNKKS